MSIQQNETPAVLILSQALDVIRRESLKFDVETGGILLGSKTREGTILVTHATPPGPNAVHNAVYFKRDVQYQQKILDGLHLRYGTEYLGEWHKHPRTLPVPSEGDRHGVIDLLNDSDYNVESILFPIVICERDLGFQIHPFYMAKNDHYAQFRPLKWQEIALALDRDHVFSWTDDQIREEIGNAQRKPVETFTCQVEKNPNDYKTPPSQTPLSRVDHLLPCCKLDEKSETVEDSECATIAEDSSKPFVQWYETEPGRKRLALEAGLMKSFGLQNQTFVLEDKSLGLSISRAGGSEIVVIYDKEHPRKPPRISIRKNADANLRIMKDILWDETIYVADIIVPLIGPDLGVFNNE